MSDLIRIYFYHTWKIHKNDQVMKFDHIIDFLSAGLCLRGVKFSNQKTNASALFFHEKVYSSH